MDGPYVVTTRTVPMRSGRGGRFARPVKIIVLDTRVSEWHAARGIIAGYVVVAERVDSRNTGPRSAYGIAKVAAQAIAAAANLLVSENQNVES